MIVTKLVVRVANDGELEELEIASESNDLPLYATGNKCEYEIHLPQQADAREIAEFLQMFSE